MTATVLVPRAGATSRRLLALAELAALATLVALVLVDAAPPLRLSLTLLVVTTTPGVALLGLSDIERTATWLALVISTSLATTTLAATAMAYGGWLRPEPFVIVLTAICAPLLLVQLGRLRRA